MTLPVKLPPNVLISLKRGLELYEGGFAGKGLMASTVNSAKRGIQTGYWPQEKIKKAAAWFSRHEKNKRDKRIGGSPSKPTPTYVAWGLWGGFMGGRNFIDREARRLKGLKQMKRNPAKCPPGCQAKRKPAAPKKKRAPLPKCFGECGRWNAVKDREEKKLGVLFDGPQGVVYTSEGEALPVRYAMVELDKVEASHNSRGTRSDSYRQELQARQRDSKVSRAQISDLAKELNPYMLMIPSSGLSDGAPVVAMVFTKAGKPQMQVISGNGRIAAIKSKRGNFWDQYDVALVERFQSRPLQSFLKRNKKKTVLVRILDLDDMGTPEEIPEAALRAAAGSQTTQSAELSILESAISQARAANLKYPTFFGPFNFTDAITGSNVRNFIRSNREWFKIATQGISSARKSSIVGDPDASADFVNNLLLGSLPPEFVNTQLARRMTKPQFSEALIGSLPALVTIDSLISRGLASPEWNLSNQLMSAARWVQKAGSKAISAIARDVDIDTRQGDLIPQEDVDAKDTDRLGVAFAVALLRAARRQNPSAAISEYLTAYVNKIPDPNQQGIFGEAPTADPAQTLAQIVRFKFVDRPTRSNPQKSKRNPSTADYWEFLNDLKDTGSRGMEIWRDDDADLLSEAKGHREARGTRRRAFITKTGKQALSVYKRQLPLFNPAHKDASKETYNSFLSDLAKAGRGGMVVARDGDRDLLHMARIQGHATAKKQTYGFAAYITQAGENQVKGIANDDFQMDLLNPAKPRFVMIGDRVDLDLVQSDGKTKTYKMGDNVAVATEPDMKSIFFVTIGKPSNANPKKAAEAWEGWTWGSDVDAVFEAERPTGDQVRTVGKIKRIYYDGRLAEQAEGQSRRVHDFKKPYPLLIVLTDGVTVTRGSGVNASRYKVTERGIIG